MLLNSQKNHDVSKVMEISGRSSLGFFKNKSGEVFDVLKINGVRGLRSLSIDEIEHQLLIFSKDFRNTTFSQTYVVMSSYIDFSEQIKFYQHRMKFLTNDSQRMWLQYEIDRLTHYQTTLKEEMYYLLVFSDTQKNLLNAKAYLKQIRMLNVVELEDDEKVKLLRKLHNPLE